MFLILTTADTEIQALAAAVRRLPDDFPPVRARNANELQSPEALDRFVADDLPAARAVVVRVLGGRPYFADGFERLSRECRARGHRLHRPARRAGARPRADRALPRPPAARHAGPRILHPGRRRRTSSTCSAA